MLKWVSSSEFNGGCCGDHHDDEDTPKSKLGWATKFLPSKAAKSTSVTPSAGSSRTDNDAKLELGELQRVLCACCYEKDILRKADSNQSDTVSVSTDSVSKLSRSLLRPISNSSVWADVLTTLPYCLLVAVL